MTRFAIAWAVLVASGCQIVFPLDAAPDASTPIDDVLRDGADASDAPAPCAGYAPVPGTPGPSKYRLEQTPATWLAAAKLCADDPGPTHLAVMNDMIEVSALAEFFMTDEAWIGFADRKLEGTFVTVSVEEPGFPASSVKGNGSEPWLTLQPDDGNNNQDCVLLNGTNSNQPFTIDDEDCVIEYVFICECDAFENSAVKYE